MLAMANPQHPKFPTTGPILAGFVALILWGNAHGATLSGEVVALADGDTITVLDSENIQHKIRLAGIDAPEKHQAFGARSRQGLAALVFRRQVTVDWHKRDRYGRIVGKVLVHGVDACLQQLKTGLAWHYVAYAREQSPEDRSAYRAAEATARLEGVGLWRDPSPIPPWDFRRQHRESP